MSAIRDALAAKQPHVVAVRIPVVKQSIVDERQDALREAKQRQNLAQYQDDKALLDRATKDVEAAQAALEGCLFTIHLQGMSDDADFDALQTKHTSDGEDGELDYDAFCLALLEHCALDSDLTADDWRAELWSPKWTRAERAEIFRSVIEANTTTGTGIPNG